MPFAAFTDDLDEAARFERLVADLAARFVHVPPRELDATIVDCQRAFVEALDLDRSTLFLTTDTGGLVNTHHWSRSEFPLPPLGTSATDRFPWIVSRLRLGETVAIVSADELGSPTDRESFVRFGTKATVAVPLMQGGKLAGILSFGALRASRPWPAAVLDRLRLIAMVFAQALARRRTQEELERALDEVRRLRDQLARDNVILTQDLKARRFVGDIPTESDAARGAFALIEQVAPTGATVLLLGETGAGKEMFAEAIHEQSPRHKRPMVRVNCAAIPTTLIESELFGRERGAYTGALSRQIGRFELAHGSTIFLDEIGDLPIDAQVKLLRAIEHHVIERLGSVQSIKVDVRIVAATNRNLEEAVAARTFREDLYYRLNVFPIVVPPLRERVHDIPALVWAFVQQFSKTLGKTVESVSAETLRDLQRYSWPGNIRELRNVVERAMILATGPRLTIAAPGTTALVSRQKSLKIADVEASHIRAVLDGTGWRVRGAGGAADLLDMKPTTLEGRMAKLGIRRNEKRP